MLLWQGRMDSQWLASRRLRSEQDIVWIRSMACVVSRRVDVCARHEIHEQSIMIIEQKAATIYNLTPKVSVYYRVLPDTIR